MAQRNWTSGWWRFDYNTGPDASGGGSWVYCGSTRDGLHLRQSQHVYHIQSDEFGDAHPDSILQGVDYTVEGVFVEFARLLDSGILDTQPGQQGQVNTNVGLRASDLYGALCMTPLPGTPSASAQYLGAGKSIIAYSAGCINDIEELLSSKPTEPALTFELLPALNHSNLAYVIANTPALTGIVVDSHASFPS